MDRSEFNKETLRIFGLTNINGVLQAKESKEDKKPMKATIIYYVTNEPRSEVIEVASPETLIDEVSKWCRDEGCQRRFVHFVHYDGMLFEYTSKPILAEVTTGIEI